jgi:hypothetical protein
MYSLVAVGIDNLMGEQRRQDSANNRSFTINSTHQSAAKPKRYLIPDESE